MTTRRIEIDPITRLEGHGKISIFLDEAGDVDRAVLQIPELRGFEAFCVGRPAEEMPRITTMICGVCPTAHHLAATKALDALYDVTPPAAARRLRELLHSAFMVEDHLLHFFFLGGPDFVVGASAPKAERNILGVVARVGAEVAARVLEVRKRCREVLSLIGGRAVHPVCGLPGGVSKALTEADRPAIREAARQAIDLCEYALEVFDRLVLQHEEHRELVLGDAYQHRTHYLGMVDEAGKVSFYDGHLRVIDPDGTPIAEFGPSQYADYIAEHVEPWSYVKFAYLRPVGWKGFVDGADSGVFRVAPLARLNVADGLATPRAQAAYDKMREVLGPGPHHYTLAFHWARLIEALFASERMLELAEHPELCDPDVRVLPTATPRRGVGIVEAPRGTLIHHYETDPRGVITAAHLMVATQNNAAAISLSIEKAAKAFIRGGQISDGLLNLVEMAFRAYDPCFACATHSFAGATPLRVDVLDVAGRLLRRMERTR